MQISCDLNHILSFRTLLLNEVFVRTTQKLKLQMTPIPVRNLTNSKSSNNGDCRLWGYLLFRFSAKFIYICDHFSFPSPFLFTKLFIPIGVLTHKKSFVLKKSYTKVFNPKESNFDLDTCMGREPKLIFFLVEKIFNGVVFQ